MSWVLTFRRGREKAGSLSLEKKRMSSRSESKVGREPHSCMRVRVRTPMPCHMCISPPSDGSWKPCDVNGSDCHVLYDGWG